MENDVLIQSLTENQKQELLNIIEDFQDKVEGLIPAGMTDMIGGYANLSQLAYELNGGCEDDPTCCEDCNMYMKFACVSGTQEHAFEEWHCLKCGKVLQIEIRPNPNSNPFDVTSL